MSEMYRYGCLQKKFLDKIIRYILNRIYMQSIYKLFNLQSIVKRDFYFKGPVFYKKY